MGRPAAAQPVAERTATSASAGRRCIWAAAPKSPASNGSPTWTTRLTSRSLWRLDARPTIQAPLTSTAVSLGAGGSGMADHAVDATRRFHRPPIWPAPPITRSLFECQNRRDRTEARSNVPDAEERLCGELQAPDRAARELFLALAIRRAQQDRPERRGLILARHRHGNPHLRHLQPRIRQGAGTGVASVGRREILGFSISQSYYTDARAAAVDTPVSVQHASGSSRT